jgi:HD-GYP domain-containing protein (c-di-GMP phosphodiesterase class II)
LALLHDIGKIGIEEKILRKPSKLTDHEWEQVKNHAALGGSIIKPIKFLQEGEKIVRHHHEWYDGSGYPDGLKGNAIPLFSRIIAVADAFDAMTSVRPYRENLGVYTALDELRRFSGKQFDPGIVELFLNAFEERIH